MTSPIVRSTIARVAVGPVEQALLADRADDALDRVVVRTLRDRQLADAVQLQEVDRGADSVGRPGKDDGRQVRAAVARPEQLLDAHDRAGGRQQAVRPHPLVVVELREVVPAAVREDHHDDRSSRGGAVVAHDPARLVERGDERRPARLAREDPLLPRDPSRHRERVTVRDAHPAIDHRRVVRAREEVLADALGQVRPRGVAGQHGALGVRAHDHQVRLLGLAGSGRRP